MKSKSESFIVRVQMPEGWSTEQIRRYIKEAVGTWCKQSFMENDPIFDLRIIGVTPFRKKLKRKT